MNWNRASLGLLLVCFLFSAACETEESGPNNTDAQAVANNGYFFNGKFYGPRNLNFAPEFPYWTNEVIINGEISNADRDIWFIKMLDLGDEYTPGNLIHAEIVVDHIEKLEGPTISFLPGLLDAWKCTDISVSTWTDCAPEDIQQVVLDLTISPLQEGRSYPFNILRGEMLKLIVDGLALPNPNRSAYRIKIIQP